MTKLEITPEALLDNLEMHRKLAEEGADEIKRLRAENDKLRAALKPFADCVDLLGDQIDEERARIMPLAGQIRAAAAALKETGE